MLIIVCESILVESWFDKDQFGTMETQGARLLHPRASSRRHRGTKKRRKAAASQLSEGAVGKAAQGLFVN